MDDKCEACGFEPFLPATLVAELELPISWPSQNQLGGNARGNAGWHYRRLRQEFAGVLHAALASAAVPKATGKRRAWMKRIYRPGKRAYDVANLIGGGKHIVDVLTSRGILRDDSPKYFEGIYSQAPGPADSIQIRIYNIDPYCNSKGTTPMHIFTPPDDKSSEDKELALLAQFPSDAPPLPYDMDDDFPMVDRNPEYSTEPPGLRTIALPKSKYETRKSAMTRAREICLGRGEKLYRFFEQAHAWVAQVYTPLPKLEQF